MNYEIIHGDSIKVIAELADKGVQVDSIITDPPYGLSLFGKKWDYDVPSAQFWEVTKRILKPNGILVAFSGSRTYHRMTINIEDAGYVIEDLALWMYGSGFPKGQNISLMIDKQLGVERKVIAEINRTSGGLAQKWVERGQAGYKQQYTVTEPATPQAKQWDGWNTTLKPAFEPLTIATLDGLGVDDKLALKSNDTSVSPNDLLRFLYCPKPSAKERKEFVHPTIKPVALMRYLCKMFVPKGGIVLDPFCGSGTTCQAAFLEGFDCIGIEREAEYIKEINEKMAAVQGLTALFG